MGQNRPAALCWLGRFGSHVLPTIYALPAKAAQPAQHCRFAPQRHWCRTYSSEVKEQDLNQIDKRTKTRKMIKIVSL